MPIHYPSTYHRRSFPMESPGPSSSPQIFIQDYRPEVVSNEVREENRDVHRDPQEVMNEIVIAGFRDRPKFYCMRALTQQSDCRNCDTLECFVTFKVDRDIFVLGIQVPSQTFTSRNTVIYKLPILLSIISHNLYTIFQPAPPFQVWDIPKADTKYTEILYANLLDSDGARLTYTHFTTKANLRELVEISFNRPVYIQKNKVSTFLCFRK